MAETYYLAFLAICVKIFFSSKILPDSFAHVKNELDFSNPFQFKLCQKKNCQQNLPSNYQNCSPPPT